MATTARSIREGVNHQLKRIRAHSSGPRNSLGESRGFLDLTRRFADACPSDGRAAAAGVAAEGPWLVVAGDRVPGELLASGRRADHALRPAAAGPLRRVGARTGAADPGRPRGDHPGG